MTTTNQLPLLDTLSAADQVPVWSTSGGYTGRAPLSALTAFIAGEQQSPGGFVTQYAAPNATNFTVTVLPPINGQNVRLRLTPVAAYAAGTIALPPMAACADGQEVAVGSTQAVTTLTVSADAPVNGAPTGLAANGFFRLQFDGVLQSWYRIG